jgi:hypothetical protein
LYTPTYLHQDIEQHYSVIDPLVSDEAKEYWTAVDKRESELWGSKNSIGFLATTYGTFIGAFAAKYIFTGQFP